MLRRSESEDELVFLPVLLDDQLGIVSSQKLFRPFFAPKAQPGEPFGAHR